MILGYVQSDFYKDYNRVFKVKELPEKNEITI